MTLLGGTVHTRACLDQHLTALRSLCIHGNHLRSGISMIAIIYIAGPSHLLTRHLATVINCTVLLLLHVSK